MIASGGGGRLERVRSRIRGWRQANEGVAAVEFALIIPLLILLLFGLTEVTMGVSMERKLIGLSRSVVDLGSRVSSITTTDMSNIFNASTAMMQPYDTTTLKMTLSSIKVTLVGSNYVGTVDWSCARGTGATALVSGTAYTVPAGYKTANTYFLVADTLITYKPLFFWVVKTRKLLEIVTPWPIRNVSQVAGPGTCPS